MVKERNMPSDTEVILRPKQISGGGCPLIVQLQGGCSPPFQGAPANLMIESSSQKLKVAACWDGVVRWGDENADMGVRQVLLARNRRTGKVRLIEVGSASLQPFIPRNTQKHLEIDSLDDVKLSEKFGSKKQKRYYEQTKKHKIDVDTIKEQLEETALNMNVSVSKVVDTPTAEDMSENYIPPIDREANDARNVYKLDKILSAEEKDALKSFSEQILEGDSENITVSDFMKKYIGLLQHSTNTLRIENCIAMLYADSILNYVTCDYKKASAINCVICPYSEIINKSVLEKFSVQSGKSRNRPKSLKDKAMCYIIVLLLISSNLKFLDYDKLRELFHIPASKMSQLVKILGARIISVEGSNAIVLKLPLTKPPSIQMKRDRK